jgi:fatty-acyl-CoA synthase
MLDERIRTNAWAARSVQALFRETCARAPDKPAIVYRGQSVSYSQLQRRVDALTQGLIQAGIGPGDVVATLPSPTPDFVVGFFAVLQTGATLNPLNLMWERDTLAAVLQRNAPRVLITTAQSGKTDYVQLLRQCFGEAPQDNVAQPARRPAQVLVSDDTGTVADLPAGFARLRDFEIVPDAAGSASIARRVTEFDPAQRQFICQTSGSTGLPKSALWNHRSPLSTANFVAAHMGLAQDDRWINLSPFFHNSGICCTIAMGIAYVGMTVYLSDRFDPDEAVRTIQDEGVHATFGFGAHWVAMHASRHYQKERFKLKAALVAGPAAFYRDVRNICGADTRIHNLYAQTENGPMIAMTELGNVDEALRASNSGRPLPGVQLKICEVDSGALLPDGKPGQIWYKSPYLFVGYLQEDGSVKLPLDDEGYFASGDFGVMRGGHLDFIERLGGVVKSGGENVSLAKVSTALAAEFGAEFETIHAVAIPDPYWGDRVVAIGRPKVPGTVTTEAMRARCKETLAAYEIPRNLLEWHAPWPVSPEGKLGVKQLRDYAVANVDTSQR